MKHSKWTLAVGIAMPLLVMPATSAGAAEAPPYCMGIIGSSQSWCAETEAGLAAIRSTVLGARSALASTRLVDLYDAADRTGSYYSLYGTACDTNADVDGSYALPSAWNDRISSFQGFGNCETKLYQNGDFTGSTYGPVFATDYVGATMNDEASSLRVY